MKKSYYEILGVKDDATLKQIKDRYKVLKEKYYPEKKDSKKWKDIKEAYSVLSNKEERIKYNESLVLEEPLIGEVVTPKEEEVEVEAKAYFLPRLLAYFLDIFLITTIASFIFTLFPASENVVKLNEQMIEVQTNYFESIRKEDITEEEVQEITDRYIAQNFDLSYDMAYQSVILVIIESILAVGYFVVFQYKRGGRTLGKQIFRIKVVSSSSKPLTMNQYLFRALILQAIFVDIISVIAVLLMSKSLYGSFNYGLQLVQMIIIIVTVVMVLCRKDGRGLHDIIAGSRVVMDGSKEKVLCES